jgi:hypothetical protein
MRRLSLSFVSVASCIALAAPAAHAQLMASEPGSVTQTVDGTKISVDYSRPRARGRTGLFGTRIHWGETWTPGANAATTLTLSKDATINGTAVPKGKYSVWMVVARGDWELLLDPDTMLFHTQIPKARSGQIRLPLTREKRPFMETLSWWFPEITATSATLAMQWDTVYVPLRIAVPASYTRSTPADRAAPLVGRYQMHLEPMGPPGPPDTSAHAPEAPASDVTFTIRYEGGELRAIMDPPMFTRESGYRDWIVLPGKGTWFSLGRMDKGELVEIPDFVQMKFDIADGKATGFELRTPDDHLMAKARRIP